MDNVTAKWQEARKAIALSSLTAEQLIGEANKKKKSVLYFHYGNILVLSLTAILLTVFFYKYPFRNMISKAGMYCMVGGLLIRIIIEVDSSIRSRAIQFGKDVSQTTQDALTFYNYRKKVHGPVTLSIAGLYVLGFYLLTPEFSTYINLKWMIMMHVSFVAGAGFLIFQIRKGIQKEMRTLVNLMALKKELAETNL